MASNLPSVEENFNERRIFPRFYPAEALQVELNSLGASEIYHQLVCLDISETGLKIRCPLNKKLPFIDTSLIEVRLAVPSESEQIAMLGRIQRVQEQGAYRLLALRIVQIGIRDKEILRHLVNTRTTSTH